MLCRQCNKTIEADSKFCQFCGRPQIALDEISCLLSVKPLFVPQRWIIPAAYNGIFMTFFGTVGLGTIVVLAAEFACRDCLNFYGVIATYAFLFIVLLIISVPLQLRIMKEKCKKTDFRFYSDRAEYDDGFLGKAQQVMPFDQITQMQIDMDWLQKYFMLGDIILSVSGAENISMKEVKDPEFVLSELRKIMCKGAK